MLGENLKLNLKELQLECLTCSCSGSASASCSCSGCGCARGGRVPKLAEIAKRAATEHAMARTNVDIKLLTRPGLRGGVDGVDAASGDTQWLQPR